MSCFGARAYTAVHYYLNEAGECTLGAVTAIRDTRLTEKITYHFVTSSAVNRLLSSDVQRVMRLIDKVIHQREILLARHASLGATEPLQQSAARLQLL